MYAFDVDVEPSTAKIAIGSKTSFTPKGARFCEENIFMAYIYIYANIRLEFFILIKNPKKKDRIEY